MLSDLETIKQNTQLQVVGNFIALGLGFTYSGVRVSLVYIYKRDE